MYVELSYFRILPILLAKNTKHPKIALLPSQILLPPLKKATERLLSIVEWRYLLVG
jgi:hypothetical protein